SLPGARSQEPGAGAKRHARDHAACASVGPGERWGSALSRVPLRAAGGVHRTGLPEPYQVAHGRLARLPDVLPELDLRLLLDAGEWEGEAGLPNAGARRAAAGWDGPDRPDGQHARDQGPGR